MRYFAYGANMASGVLRRRGVEVVASRAARLPGYRLTFEQPGIPWLEPVFATVSEAPGASVHGVLHELEPAQLAKLDQFEGLGYDRVSVEIEPRAQMPVEATMYLPRVRTFGRRPSRRYIDLLLEGAREHGLPDTWIERLEREPTYRLPLFHRFVPQVLVQLERLQMSSPRADALMHRFFRWLQ